MVKWLRLTHPSVPCSEGSHGNHQHGVTLKVVVILFFISPRRYLNPVLSHFVTSQKDHQVFSARELNDGPIFHVQQE